MVDYSDRYCETCGAPLIGREGKKSCSGRCRAALSRRKKAQAQKERDQRLQRLVETLAQEMGLRVEDSG